jgi:integrase
MWSLWMAAFGKRWYQFPYEERTPDELEKYGWSGGWPLRGRYSGRTEPLPLSRKTAHDWHELALEDASLRDMPLHALRHTAATAWLATGHPLIFVQRQLGHR